MEKSDVLGVSRSYLEKSVHVDRMLTPSTTHSKSRRRGCLVCSICNKLYKTKRTLQNHLKTHSLKDIIAELPPDNEILDKCVQGVARRIRAMSCASPETPGDVQQHQLAQLTYRALNKVPEKCCRFLARVGLLMCKILEDRWEKEAAPQILEAAYSGFSVWFDVAAKESIADALLECVTTDFPKKVIYIFLTDLILEVCNEVVSWFVKIITIKLGVDSTTSKPAPTVSPAEESALYYSGGCHIKGAERLSKTSRLSLPDPVPSILKQGAECVEERVKRFTQAQNRGGLTLSGQQFHLFTMEVVGVLKGMTDLRALSHENVLAQVQKDGLNLCLWQNIFKDCSHSLDNSAIVMNWYIKKITNTFLRGLTNKIRNETDEAPLPSQPLRASLAGKVSNSTPLINSE